MTDSRTDTRFVSLIILAAGSSSRMGRPKQTLPWMGKDLLTYQVEQGGLSGVDELIVVLGENAEDYRPLLPESLERVPVYKIIENPDYERGKTTSVLAGLAAADPRATDWIFLAMDAPKPAHITDMLVEAHHAGGLPITYPWHNGIEGHPPVMNASLRSEIEAITEARRGLREITERDRDRVNRVEFADPIVIVNMNSPEDYERALVVTGQATSPSP